MLCWAAHICSIWILHSLWEWSKFPLVIRSDQIRSVAQSCPTLCDPMNRSTPGLPVHHQLLEFTETHIHRVSDAIQPSHPLSSPSPPAPNPSQHQSLFQWVNSSHEVAKILEFRREFFLYPWNCLLLLRKEKQFKTRCDELTCEATVIPCNCQLWT